MALSFRFHHAGSDDLYRVERSWEADGRSVSESLRVERNGRPADDIDESQWQAFIEGLVPLGIARLFFFDGEKIEGAAGGSSGGGSGGGGAMRDSLDALLGAELVDRLSADLDLYVARRAGRSGEGGGGPAASDLYQSMLAERDRLLADVEALKAEASARGGRIAEAESRVAAEEAKIRGAGGGYADLRSGLLAEKAAAEERLRGHARSIRDALSGAAPLSAAGGLLARTTARIDKGRSAARSAAAAAAAAERIDSLREEMRKCDFWPGGRVDEAVAERVIGRLEELFRPAQEEGSRGGGTSDDHAAVAFDTSESDAAAVRAAADAASAAPPAALCAEFEGHDAAERSLEAAAEGLARAPSDDEMAALVGGIRELHREIGMLRAELEHAEQRLSSREANLKVVRNRLRSLLDEMHREGRVDRGVELAGRMRAALSTYRERLLARKMRELEANLLAAMRMLLHKGGVERISINPDTLEVGAYEKGAAEPVPLASMGERQMIGTALLWAIAKTSGRPLPFVIDTPLGRLDGAHLSNLVGRFYPAASHQMVLLSTDREIGAREYARLRRHVARAYVVEHDPEQRRTVVREGYFGGRGGAGNAGGRKKGGGGDDIPA